jgi:hypothetical protein
MTLRETLLAVALLAAMLASPSRAIAHCDTLDGPVVSDARAALEARDVTPVLKWVEAGKEPEVREAFRHALAVRVLGPEARTLADRFFFETLVRVHREGEGEPYTGLKPAGAGLRGRLRDVRALRGAPPAGDHGCRPRGTRRGRGPRRLGRAPTLSGRWEDVGVVRGFSTLSSPSSRASRSAS